MSVQYRWDPVHKCEGSQHRIFGGYSSVFQPLSETEMDMKVQQ